VLTLRDLAIDYPGFAGRYTLDVPTGGLCAIVGPSGGGKTTLLSAIAGFEPISGGVLEIDGRSILGLPPARRPVSVLFQDYNLFPHLSVLQNVGLGVRPDLRLDPADVRTAEEALASVDLAGMGSRRPATLSGGERQRAALARALVMDRPVLLLDEAFGPLDPGLRLEMLALVDRLRRARGLTVVMSIHTPEDVVGVADSVAFVEGGRVLLQDAPEAVFGSGLEAVQRFLGRWSPQPR
jgi:thiamine transport system ATP-binding protein